MLFRSPAELSNVVAIAYEDSYGLALRSDGSVAAWGFGWSEQTNLPPNLTNIAAIACGDYHSLALRFDSTVVAWGTNKGGTNVPAGLSNVVAVAAGYAHSVALRADGSIVTWRGDYDFGQTIIPAGLRRVTAIAANGNHSLALIGERQQVLPPELSVARMSGGLSLKLSGQPGGRYVLESARVLSPPQPWQFFKNLRMPNQSVYELNPVSNEAPQGFYRARLVP